MERTTTYIVNDNCIKCKHTDCVEVGENVLIIHPDECIDCGVCEPECPVDAIKPDTEPDLAKWLVLDREYTEKWLNITAKKDAPKDADIYRDEKGKFDKYFSPNPGEGDTASVGLFWSAPLARRRESGSRSHAEV